MTDLARIKVDIAFTPGGPGCNVWTFSQGSLPGWDSGALSDLADEIKTHYMALNSIINGQTTVTVPGFAEIFDADSGEIVEVMSITGGSRSWTQTDGDSQPYNGVSVCANLKTGVYHGGRELRGRHFIGPVSVSCYTNGGVLNAGVAALIEGSYTALISGVGPRLAIYHRPPAGGLTGGYYEDVQVVQVKNGVSYLRSRAN